MKKNHLSEATGSGGTGSFKIPINFDLDFAKIGLGKI